MMVNLELKNPLLSTHSSNLSLMISFFFHSSPYFFSKIGSFENV